MRSVSALPNVTALPTRMWGRDDVGSFGIAGCRFEKGKRERGSFFPRSISELFPKKSTIFVVVDN